MDIATSAGSVNPQLDVVEPRIQDGYIVENIEIPLDNAKGDNRQLEDLPQMISDEKHGVRSCHLHIHVFRRQAADVAPG
ncbi:hypothetical protein AAFF_G00088990 [Aldrovandia affinis]|uniref:Uncharacterized protein n=1 Tax=Aldrovandia affinis TaxID=143900 RepID=A0AAD7VXJ5_9TELE|nr:hypothetical protein AAFF_G00088990 [Aldrovandia affinis]